MIYTSLPAGKYYIGDACYALSSYVYENVFGPQYQDGIYEHNGHKFVIGGTAFGDGEYTSNDNHIFCVDAGIISIIPFELCAKDEMYLNTLGWVYDFHNPVHVSMHQGLFTFNDICINTTSNTFAGLSFEELCECAEELEEKIHKMNVACDEDLPTTDYSSHTNMMLYCQELQDYYDNLQDQALV